MPRNDFVQACIDSVEKLPRVVNSTIKGLTLQDFLMKQKPVLYSAFCRTMVGQQHPTDGKCIKHLSDVDARLMVSVLDDQQTIKKTAGEFSVNESYLTLKTIHEFAMDPNGLQVANYVTLVAKCLYIAGQLNAQSRFPSKLDDFFNSFTDGALETCNDFIESLAVRGGQAMDTLRIYAEKAGRLSHWRDRDKYYALFPQFTEEALRFCMAEQKSSQTLSSATGTKRRTKGGSAAIFKLWEHWHHAILVFLRHCARSAT